MVGTSNLGSWNSHSYMKWICPKYITIYLRYISGLYLRNIWIQISSSFTHLKTSATRLRSAAQPPVDATWKRSHLGIIPLLTVPSQWGRQIYSISYTTHLDHFGLTMINPACPVSKPTGASRFSSTQSSHLVATLPISGLLSLALDPCQPELRQLGPKNETWGAN